MPPITRTKTGSLPKTPDYVDVPDSSKSSRSQTPSRGRSRSRSKSRVGLEAENIEGVNLNFLYPIVTITDDDQLVAEEFLR